MSKKQKTAALEAEERQFWQMVFETHQGSGLSVKEFCQKEGLAEWTFYHRKRRLRQGSMQKPRHPSGEKPLAFDESVVVKGRWDRHDI